MRPAPPLLACLALAIPALLGSTARPAAAALQTVPESAVDAVMAPYAKPDGPGCTVGVADDQSLLLAKGYGAANLELGVPNSADTVLPIGSNSKQFTAALVALLAEDGSLDLDADIRRYLPELPDYGTPITARELVHHTGALRDYQALRMLAGVPPEHVDAQQVFELLVHQRGLQAKPGRRFDYDNSGYVLLRFLVEKIAGKPLPQLAHDRIFAPLGMEHTRWLEDYTTLVQKRATAYAGDRTRGFRAAYSTPVMGSGGVLTTVGDLAKWHANFYRNKLGKARPELIAELLAPGTLADGTPIHTSEGGAAKPGNGYGFGLFLDQYKGHAIVWHAGTGPGYVADTVRFPDDKLSVFVLCNGVIDSRMLSRRIADLYLGIAPPPSAPAAAATATPAAKPAEATRPATRTTAPKKGSTTPTAMLDQIAGRYRNPDSGAVWALTRDGGALLLDLGRITMRLEPSGAGELRDVEPDWGWIVRYDAPIGGAAPHLHLFEDGKETASYDRLPTAPAAAKLAAYAGRFRSDELGATYDLRVEGGELALHTPVQPNGELLYLGGDSFVLATEWFDVRFDFERDATGKVSSFAVDAGPASGIVFVPEKGCGG